MSTKKFKVGDMVTVNWFPNTDDITCILDMELCFGKTYTIDRIDSVDKNIYYVAGWAWPKSALTPPILT